MKRAILSGAALVALFFIGTSAHAASCTISYSGSYATKDEASAAAASYLDEYINDCPSLSSCWGGVTYGSVWSTTQGDKYTVSTSRPESCENLRVLYHYFSFPPPETTCAQGELKTLEFELDSSLTAAENLPATNQIHAGCYYRTTYTVEDCYEVTDTTNPDRLGKQYCTYTYENEGIPTLDPNTAEMPVDGIVESFTEKTELVADPSKTDSNTIVGAASDGCITNGTVTTCIETITEVTEENIATTVTFDPTTGEFSTATNNGGTNTTTTTTETSTDSATGETSTTVSTVNEVFDYGHTNCIWTAGKEVCLNEGENSSTSISSISTKIDADGKVLESSSTEESTSGDDSDYSSNVSGLGDKGKADWTGFEETVSGWADHTGIQDTIEQNKLDSNYIIDHFRGTGAACSATQFQITFMGVSMSMDVCPFIEAARKLLYWAFAMFTMIYIYSTWLSAFGGKK